MIAAEPERETGTEATPISLTRSDTAGKFGKPPDLTSATSVKMLDGVAARLESLGIGLQNEHLSTNHPRRNTLPAVSVLVRAITIAPFEGYCRPLRGRKGPVQAPFGVLTGALDPTQSVQRAPTRPGSPKAMESQLRVHIASLSLSISPARNRRWPLRKQEVTLSRRRSKPRAFPPGDSAIEQDHWAAVETPPTWKMGQPISVRHSCSSGVSWAVTR